MRETLTEYEPATAEINQAGVEIFRAPALGGNFVHIEVKPGIGKTAQMMQVVTKILENGAAHRKALLDELVAKGIMGKEKNPMQALAIFLSSNKDVFDFDGNGNWKLRKENAR